MDLGIIELHLQPHITLAVAPEVIVRNGPPVAGPTTGLRNEVFIHAARFEDLGGVTPDGAYTARRPARVAAASTGYSEERPARIVVDVTCTSGSYRQMQQLCAAVTPAALVALERLSGPVLASLPTRGMKARFADASAVVHGCETTRFSDDIVVSYRGRVTFHLNGFLHLTVTWEEAEQEPARPPARPTLRVEFDPKGVDLQEEHVVVSNDDDAPIDLAGWVLRDAAKKPRRFVFPDVTLAPHSQLRVWTGRGKADTANLYWGRRQAVWNNIGGDAAILLDGDGTEVSRAAYTVPKPRRVRS